MESILFLIVVVVLSVLIYRLSRGGGQKQRSKAKRPD